MANREKSLRSLGSDYINDFFRGAMFLDKEKNCVYKIITCMERGLATCAPLSLNTTLEDASWGARTIVNLFEKDGGNFSLFSWPKMGYRNIPSPTFGNVVYYLQTERSTARGLRDESLSRTKPGILSAIADYVYTTCYYDSSPVVRAYVVYNPKWYTYKEGMQKLKAGEWLCFALNEDIAIFVAHETADTNSFDIYFRGVLAGTISEEGHIVMRNKILTRSSLQKLLSRDT